MIVIGWRQADLARYCGSLSRAATNDNGYGLDNDEQGVPIWLCRERSEPWSRIWPDVRSLG